MADAFKMAWDARLSMETVGRAIQTIKLNKSIAVDFDGTLCATAYPDIGKRRWIHKVVAWYIRWKYKQGWIVIINTLRDAHNDKVGINPHKKMLRALQEWQIPYNIVNDNDPSATKEYGYARKINATRYLDDRNVGLIGWLLRLHNR